VKDAAPVVGRYPFGETPPVEDGTGAPSVAEYSPTEERILAMTIRLVSRRGVRHLGMQEVSEAAGVSRATLYRYFPSKDHLFAAAANFDGRRFEDGLASALAATETPTDRMKALVAFAFDYIRTHPARSLFDTEPQFVLGYLLGHLPQLRAALIESLGEALDTVPAVASGSLDRGQMADLIVRLFASSWIIPELDDRDLVQAITGLLTSTAGRTDGYIDQ
jgi:AcrR family transcriptional regulator